MKSLSKFTITEQRENKRLVGNGETFGKFLSTYHLAPGTPGESGAWPCELIPISIVRPEVALMWHRQFFICTSLHVINRAWSPNRQQKRSEMQGSDGNFAWGAADKNIPNNNYIK